MELNTDLFILLLWQKSALFWERCSWHSWHSSSWKCYFLYWSAMLCTVFFTSVESYSPRASSTEIHMYLELRAQSSASNLLRRFVSSGGDAAENEPNKPCWAWAWNGSCLYLKPLNHTPLRPVRFTRFSATFVRWPIMKVRIHAQEHSSSGKQRSRTIALMDRKPDWR